MSSFVIVAHQVVGMEMRCDSIQMKARRFEMVVRHWFGVQLQGMGRVWILNWMFELKVSLLPFDSLSPPFPYSSHPPCPARLHAAGLQHWMMPKRLRTPYITYTKLFFFSFSSFFFYSRGPSSLLLTVVVLYTTTLYPPTHLHPTPFYFFFFFLPFIRFVLSYFFDLSRAALVGRRWFLVWCVFFDIPNHPDSRRH